MADLESIDNRTAPVFAEFPVPSAQIADIDNLLRLLASGLTREQAASAVRLSLGRWTTPQQVSAAADSMAAGLTTSGG
jgi:hypothetical protein